MEIKLICDLRENLPSNLINSDINFSDHPPKENILEIKSMVEQCGYSCSIFGGIPELIEANEKKICVENIIFLNLTDGLEMKCGRVQAPILLETLGAFYSGADPFQAALNNMIFHITMPFSNNQWLLYIAVETFYILLNC